MDQALTLEQIRQILLQEQADPLGVAWFLEKLFGYSLERSYIQKSIIQGNACKEFLNGNKKVQNGRQTYAICRATKALQKKFLLKDRSQLPEQEALHYLATALDTMMAEANVLNRKEVLKAAPSYITMENVYYPALMEAVQELCEQEKYSLAVAIMVLLAVFQEHISDVFPWLLPEETGNSCADPFSEQTAAMRQTAMQLLNDAAAEQGRMLAFQDVKHRIDMPHIGNLLSIALGMQGHSMASMLVENDAHESESLRSIFSAPPYDNIMLTGVGGSGKTFLLLDLGEMLLQSQETPLIPVYIPLNLFNRPAIGEQEFPVIQYFLNMLSSVKSFSLSQLQKWMQQEKQFLLFFLLDGYNEITSETAKNHLILEIKAIKRQYPAVRFLITSRYDLSDCFATGGELPFLCKRVNPLQDVQIQEFLKAQFGTKQAEATWNTLVDTKFVDILRSPMALAMYAYTLQNHAISTIPLPYPKPETIGELIGNFMEQVKHTPSLNRTESEKQQTEMTMRILYYIAYSMTKNGSFRMDSYTMENTIHRAETFYASLLNRAISADGIASFWKNEKKMGFLIETHRADQDYRFYHQNFRDYFYACFLREILQAALYDAQNRNQKAEAKQLLCQFFSEPIPEEILQFLGEILLERLYIPEKQQQPPYKTSLIEQALTLLQGDLTEAPMQEAIRQLITVSKIARHQNLSLLHFDGLDLQHINLNGIRLYDCSGATLQTASFRNAKLSEYTFQPLGHAAVVHTFCAVETYVLSISGGGIWCYDSRTRQFQFLAPYNGTYVTTSLYVPSHHLLLVGDKNGSLCFWRCIITEEGRLSIQLLPKQMMQLGNAIQHLLFDVRQDCCFAAIKGCGIWWISLRNPEQKRFLEFPEALKHYRKYHLALIAENLIFSCGAALYQIPADFASFLSESIQLFCPVTTIGLQPEEAYIYDFKCGFFMHSLYFLVNLRGRHESVILMMTANRVFEIQRKRHTDSFRGFNDLILSPDYSRFCICHKIYGRRDPCMTEVQLSTSSGDFICKPYYGNQNFEIETACYLNANEIMLSSMDRSLQIINTKMELPGSRFLGYDAGIHALFSTEEHTLYTCSYDGTIHILQKESFLTGNWHCIHAIPAHQNWIYQIKQFELDGRSILISCSHDHTIRVWEEQTERCICVISMPNLVQAIGLFPDHTIVGATKNGILGLYQVDLQKQTAIELDQLDLQKMPDLQFRRCRTLCMCQKPDGTEVLFLLAWTTQNTSVVYEILETEERKLHLKKWCDMTELTQESIILRAVDCAVLEDGTPCMLFCGSRYQEMESNFFLLQAENRATYYYRTETDSVVLPKAIRRHDALDNYNGVTAGMFFRYQGKLYAAAATYSYLIAIFAVNAVTNTELLCKCVHDTPILDLKVVGRTLFAAGANGKVFQWDLHTLLPSAISGGARVSYATEENLIFENISGFFMNYVSFSQSQTNWSLEFRKKIEQYAENGGVWAFSS